MMRIPDLFRCPISLDLFTDPVTLSTGQTYDRPFIEKWLADGNLMCPVTMQRLQDSSVVPNHTLRHVIDQWLISTGLGNISFSILEQNLQSSSESHIRTKLESLHKIRVLSAESDTAHAYLIRLGFFRVLLQLLFQSDMDVAELALECIMSLLPSADLDSLNMFKNEACLDQLILLLEQGNANIQDSLCSLIDSISLSTTTRELCTYFGQSHRLLQVLVALLECRTSDSAARAIAGVCAVEANRENVVRAGGIKGLTTYLLSSSRLNSNSLRVLATLEVLLELEIGKKVARKISNVIDVLVKNVFRVSEDQEGSEHAIGSLLLICGSSAWARAEAVSCGILTQLLLLIQSPCSVEAKAKARALLKLFRFMWAEGD